MRTVPSLSSLGPCRLRFWDPGTASAANPQHLEHIKSRNSDPNASNTHTVRSRIQHRILKHGAKTRIQEQPKQNSQQKLSTAHHKPAPVTHTKPPNKKLIIHLSTNESPAAKKPSYSLLQNPPPKEILHKRKKRPKTQPNPGDTRELRGVVKDTSGGGGDGGHGGDPAAAGRVAARSKNPEKP